MRNEIPTNSWQFSVMVSLIVLTIVFSMNIPGSGHATEFFVNDVNKLISAINSANDEFIHPGPDTVNLSLGTYILTNMDNVTDGPNGLPSISSAITINGNLPGGGDCAELGIWDDESGLCVLENLVLEQDSSLTIRNAALRVDGDTHNRGGYLENFGEVQFRGRLVNAGSVANHLPYLNRLATLTRRCSSLRLSIRDTAAR